MTSPLRAKLRVVEPLVADIYADWKADIASRDWRACHVNGDRGPVIELPAKPKWKVWR